MTPEKPQPLETKLSTKEKPKEELSLTDKDKQQIESITLSTDFVPEEALSMQSRDVIATLEQNHPLNKIWKDEEGNITGYLAFTDLKPSEAYVKYFSTNGSTGESIFAFLPNLLDEAKKLGYQKISFHGFNPRLNKVSKRFGFNRQRTDTHGGISADFFELDLADTKEDENTKKQKMIEAFQAKVLDQIQKETEKTKSTLNESKQMMFESSYKSLESRIQNLTDTQKSILKLKLARFLQRDNSIDLNTLYDAIIETPSFLDKPKGGLHRLLELHEQKTLLKIAEQRRQKAEQTNKNEYNPYEALFQSQDGKYYMARLLNMPHLEQESQYLSHCVGTSDSYINKMIKGDIEILSIKDTKTHESLYTIEYDTRRKMILQIKGERDKLLQGTEPHFPQIVEILKKLKETRHDNGEQRNFTKINPSETSKIEVKPEHILTENGEVHFRDFDSNENTFVIKYNLPKVTENTSKEDISKIIKIVENISTTPEEIARNSSEIAENTEVYIGEWNPTVYREIKEKIKQIEGKTGEPFNTEHFYSAFPDEKVFMRTLETDPSLKTPEEAEKRLKENGINIGDYSRDILYKTEFSGKQERYELVQFTVGELGLKDGTTTDEIYAKAKELGLELCPAEVGPQLRLQYEGGDWKMIAMKQISDRRGSPDVFGLDLNGDGLWLDSAWAEPDRGWHAGNRFVFLAKKT